MNKNEFKAQITRFCEVKGLEAPSNIRLREYYRALSFISDEDFAKAITHLIDNHKFNSLPQIWDFKEAKRVVCPIPETTYEYGKRDPHYSKEMHRVLWGFQQMDTIREQAIPNHKTMPVVEQSYIMDGVYSKMVRQGKVFSVQNKKWIDKQNMVGDDYFQPVEFGLGNR